MGRVYETAIAIAASISRTFKSDAKGASDALTKLAAATKQLKAAEKSAGSLKKLDGELARSKSRYNTATAALRRLEEAERAAGGATKESTRWRKAGAREVASAARQVDRATKAAQKHSEVLHKLGVDTSKLTSEQERLTRALAATERQEKSLGRYEAARERLFGARSKTPLVQKAGSQIRGIAGDAMFLGTAAVGAGAAVAGLVLKTLQAGKEIGHTANKLGIGSKALQELRYGARQTGAEAEDLDRAIAKMAINIGKHKLAKGKPTGAAIPGLQMFPLSNAESSAAGTFDAFKQIGLKAKDLVALKPEEQLKKIADGMAKLKTHAERAAVGQAIFGKGVTAILPYLAEGSAGIDKWSQSAHKFGGVLSEDAVKAAEEADRAMKDAEMALSGVVNMLGSALLPTATETFKGFSGWVAENRAQIKQWAESIAKWIKDKGLPAIRRIATEVQSFGSKVLWLVNGAAKLTGGFGNLAIVVGGLRLAPLAVTMGKIGVETYKAAAALFRYSAASKAAKAAGGGIPGGGPAIAGKAIGVAATAAMVAGAAAIGYAIGRFIDEKYGLSTKIANTLDVESQIKEEVGVAVNRGQLAKKAAGRAALVKKYEAQGLTHGQALSAADTGSAPAALPRAAGRGGSTHVAPVVQIHGSATRGDVAKGMEKAKEKVLEEFDKRQAHRKRVSFGQ